MKAVLSAELYKVRNSKLVWLASLFSIVSTVYLYMIYDHPIFDAFRGVEFFALPTIMSDTFPFAVAIVTGYLCGENFTRGTIRNVLSRGVGKKEYYFSGLLVQFGLVTIFFGLSVAAHMICRMIGPVGNGWQQIQLFGWKLFVLFVIAFVQMWASVAIFYMVCFFIKNQVVDIVVCALLILVTAIIIMAVDFYHIEWLDEVLEYTPAWVLGSMFQYAVYDRILTFDFLKYGISGIVVIVFCSVIGFIKFYYLDTDN